MNWDAIGAIGVIATLGYLAIQTKHNTRAVNASTFQGNTSIWQDMFLALAGADAPEAFAQGMRGNRDIDSLTFQKFWMVCRTLFLNFENQYYQYRQGTLDEEAFKGYEDSMCDMVLSWPGIRAWWPLNHNSYGKAYVEYIERLLTSTQESAAQRVDNPGESFTKWLAVLGHDPGPAPTRFDEP
ncbi:MAG: hypothetical protein V7709_09385 [Halioglobus sp.]